VTRFGPQADGQGQMICSIEHGRQEHGDLDRRRKQRRKRRHGCLNESWPVKKPMNPNGEAGENAPCELVIVKERPHTKLAAIMR